MSLGTCGDNMIEKGEDRQREKERDPKNEFIVKDPNGVEIMRSHYLTDCFKRLCDAYPKITFYKGSIYNCLNNDRPRHNGFTFDYVLPRPVSVLET